MLQASSAGWTPQPLLLQVIGVEPVGANAMAMSLEQGRRVTLSRVDAFADGVAVKHVSVMCRCSGRWCGVGWGVGGELVGGCAACLDASVCLCGAASY
jgi:hypothetical protein